MLVDWVYRHPSRGILVIDPSPKAVTANREHIWHFAKGWCLQSTAEELQWQTVMDKVALQTPENFERELIQQLDQPIVS